jgi:hypothetical protein
MSISLLREIRRAVSRKYGGCRSRARSAAKFYYLSNGGASALRGCITAAMTQLAESDAGRTVGSSYNGEQINNLYDDLDPCGSSALDDSILR